MTTSVISSSTRRVCLELLDMPLSRFITAVVPVSSLAWIPAWTKTTRSPVPMRTAWIGRPRFERPTVETVVRGNWPSLRTARSTSHGWK